MLLQTACLVRRILLDHIGLAVLKLTQRQQDNIAVVDPYLFAHLAANMRQALLTVKAQRLQTPIAQHPHDLCILLALVLENELALGLVIIPSAPAILTALALGLWHDGEKTPWATAPRGNCGAVT